MAQYRKVFSFTIAVLTRTMAAYFTRYKFPYTSLHRNLHTILNRFTGALVSPLVLSIAVVVFMARSAFDDHHLHSGGHSLGE
jgi:ATP/ADP translocase